VDKNTTVVFPASLMGAIGELGSFLGRETAAAAPIRAPADVIKPILAVAANEAADAN
jgi:hypothetical protein